MTSRGRECFPPNVMNEVMSIATSMTSNGKKFTVTREMLTAVAHDQSRGGLMSSLESQHVFQNLLLFCFAV